NRPSAFVLVAELEFFTATVAPSIGLPVLLLTVPPIVQSFGAAIAICDPKSSRKNKLLLSSRCICICLVLNFKMLLSSFQKVKAGMTYFGELKIKKIDSYPGIIASTTSFIIPLFDLYTK